MSRADFDKRKLNAYKSFNDYRLHENGHVQDLAIHHHKSYFIFRAMVLPTCRKQTYIKKKFYACWFILNEYGEVYTAYCECMGG